MSEPTGGPTEAAAEPVTCYRHPDREAHIRCARCNRRICPDCMVSASVGFQCPECVRAANKGQRAARTTFGGRLSGDAGYVTKGLIAVNVVVFLLQQVSRPFENRFIQDNLLIAVDHDYYRLLTAAFMHANVLHILFNMYALYLFGPPLEHVLGRLRFAALYLIAALGGSAASYAFSPLEGRSLGASGAVFGLFGAFIVVNRRMGREIGGVLVVVAINLGFGFVMPGIDWRAHLGGLVTGVLVAVAFAYAPRARRVPVQAAGSVLVLAVVVALALWRTAQLT